MQGNYSIYSADAAVATPHQPCFIRSMRLVTLGIPFYWAVCRVLAHHGTSWHILIFDISFCQKAHWHTVLSRIPPHAHTKKDRLKAEVALFALLVRVSTSHLGPGHLGSCQLKRKKNKMIPLGYSSLGEYSCQPHGKQRSS